MVGGQQILGMEKVRIKCTPIIFKRVFAKPTSVPPLSNSNLHTMHRSEMTKPDHSFDGQRNYPEAKLDIDQISIVKGKEEVIIVSMDNTNLKILYSSKI